MLIYLPIYLFSFLSPFFPSSFFFWRPFGDLGGQGPKPLRYPVINSHHSPHLHHIDSFHTAAVQCTWLSRWRGSPHELTRAVRALEPESLDPYPRLISTRHVFIILHALHCYAAQHVARIQIDAVWRLSGLWIRIPDLRAPLLTKRTTVLDT